MLKNLILLGLCYRSVTAETAFSPCSLNFLTTLK